MNLRLLKILLFLFAPFNINMSSAQVVRVMSLKQAIGLSVKNSKQLKIGAARILSANAALIEAEDNRLPGFNVSGSYLRLNSPNVALKIKSVSPDSSRPARINQAMYGLASLTYPLYTGGRIKFGIESARFLDRAVRLDAENEKQAVVLNTINAFINWYKSGKVIAIIRQSLEQSRKRDTDFLRLENNGLLARNDRLKASLQTSNLELSLLEAENNKNLANININLMLGLNENTILTPDSLSLGLVSPGSIEEYEQSAFQNRKDIMAITERQKAAQMSIKVSKAEKYPTIGLTGGYLSAYVPNLLTVSNALNLGISVQYNLAGFWKTNTSLLKARAREEELLADAEQLNIAIRLEVSQDYNNYILSTKKIAVYLKALQQAFENYRVTKNKYDNNLLTTTDLLDADVAQLQANLNLELSKADAIAAYNKLLQTSGILNIAL